MGGGSRSRRRGFLDLREKYGVGAIGGISSSRCTNEEVYVVQKMVRAAFGNNNIDTCARVCHSPTGYGLNHAFGTSAGTQDFASVEQADVMLVIGANPTDAHPVFASRMKRRMREGAQVIVADPRRIDLVRSPHVEAAFHLPVRPGTNVAFVNAMCHVIVTEGLWDEEFVRSRCEDVDGYLEFIARPEHSPEATERETGIPASELRSAARLYAAGPNSAIYYGLGVTEHSQGSTMVMGMANLAMLTGNLGREGVGVNPLRGQNNVQGSCDMGSFPHELPGYRHVSRPEVREIYESLWGVTIQAEPGLRIPNMFDAAIGGSFKGLYVQGEDIAQSDPNTQHVEAALRSMELVVVHDLFLNETARFAHVFLPGASFLEKDGTFTNAERRVNRVRPGHAVAGRARTSGRSSARSPRRWATRCRTRRRRRSWTRSPPPHRRSPGCRSTGSTPRARCSGRSPRPPRTARRRCTSGRSSAGSASSPPTVYVPTTERANRRYPLVLTTGRILSQYNVGAQTRRTPNSTWHPEDILEIHPSDAELRGVTSGDVVELSSRVGTTRLTALVSERMPAGVVYTTFHHPVTGANVVTTENSDWATNCPEYKVTAVQVEVVTEAARAEAARGRARARRGAWSPPPRRWRGGGEAAVTGSRRTPACRRSCGSGTTSCATSRPCRPRRPRSRSPRTSASSGSRGCARSCWPASAGVTRACTRCSCAPPRTSSTATSTGPRSRNPPAADAADEAIAHSARARPAAGALHWSWALSRRAAGRVVEVRAWRPSRSPVCARSTGTSSAVDGLDLTVGEGEVVALLGPNGAGKTTTVEILEGYRARDAGTVSVLGHDPQTGGRSFRERIGIVLQEAGFEDELHPARADPPARRLLPAPPAGGRGHHPDRPGREGRRPGGHACPVGRSAASTSRSASSATPSCSSSTSRRPASTPPPGAAPGSSSRACAPSGPPSC